MDGMRVLNEGGNCGQRLSFEPGKQYEGVVNVDLQPSIGEPEMIFETNFNFE